MASFEFPSEIKSMITELKNEKQWSILESIIDEDNDISYTRLREKMGFSLDEKGDLNYHIKSLERSGWLQNKVKTGNLVSDRHSSYYNVSKFGLKMLEGAVLAMDRKNYLVDSMLFFGKKLSKNMFSSFPDYAEQEQAKLKLQEYSELEKQIVNHDFFKNNLNEPSTGVLKHFVSANLTGSTYPETPRYIVPVNKPKKEKNQKEGRLAYGI